jgi:hypothetical protein
MFKPRREPPGLRRPDSLLLGGAAPAATDPKSGAARAPADKRLNSRLEIPRGPGSCFIATTFPNNELLKVVRTALGGAEQGIRARLFFGYDACALVALNWEVGCPIA